MLIVKTFQYKGQQINYFNKLVKNAKNLECAFAGTNDKGEYTVEYAYKSKKN